MIYYVDLERIIQFEFSGEVEVPDDIDVTDKQALRNYLRDQVEEDDCDRTVVKDTFIFEGE